MKHILSFAIIGVMFFPAIKAGVSQLFVSVVGKGNF